jgi:hypothetical protein
MKRWMKVSLVMALVAVPALAGAGAVALNSWGPCPMCWMAHLHQLMR